MKSSEESGSDERYGYNVWTPDSEGAIETGPLLSEPIAVIGMGMCIWYCPLSIISSVGCNRC